MSPCVEPDAIVAFAGGKLSGDALEQVEAHLDGCPSCRAAVAAVIGLESTSPGTATPQPEGIAHGLLPPGTVIGRYEVIDVAGAGGMGVIYRALDPTLNRTVALKLVRPDRSHGDAADRLLFEAKAMARVIHPDVLPVYDAGTFGEQLFIAMEWVQGRTLRAALSGPPRPWREHLDVFIRAGRGLAAAHRAGLVHRDFKPENVLLGDDGRVRVSDFGLAHDATQADVTAGTAGYMAPEVLRGEPATAAADQFAFCVALHEALCGARPGPERRPLPGPAALSRAIMRGLEPSPAARYPSMDSLVAELERVARPRARLWAAAVAVPALLGGAVWVAGVRSDAQLCSTGPERVAAVWNPQRKAALQAAAPEADAARAARVAELLDVFAVRWSASHRTACEATRVTKEQSEQLLDLKMACLQQKLTGVDALLVALERTPATAFAKAVEATQDAVTIGRCSDAAYLTAAGGAKLTGEQRAKVSSLREALSQARQGVVLGPWEPGRVRAEALLAEAKTLGVKAVEGEAHLLLAEFLRKLRTKKEQGTGLDAQLDEAVLSGTEAQYPHLLAEAWLQRMRTCTDDGRFDEAARAEHNLAANLRALGADPWLQAQHDLSLGTLLMRQSKPTEALDAYSAAEQQLALLPAEEARLLAGDLYGGEAVVHLTLGDITRGAKVLERAIAATEERFGPDHPRLGDQHHNLAEAELARGDLEAASLHVERAGKIWAVAYGPENPRVAVNLTLSAHVLAALGRSDDALAAVAEAKRIFTLHHLETQFVFMRALCAEGEVQLAKGDVSAAEAALRAGLALAPGAEGKYPLDEAGCQRALGDALAREGSRADARAAYERAAGLYRATHATGPWLARAEVGLAELDVAEGHADRAVAPLQSALATLEQQQLDPKTQARAKQALLEALDGGR